MNKHQFSNLIKHLINKSFAPSIPLVTFQLRYKCCPSSRQFSGSIQRSFKSQTISWSKRNLIRNEANSGKEVFDKQQIEKDMNSGVDRLRKKINLIVNRVGRLTSAYLDSVFVLHLGQSERIDSVAQVIVLDPNTLSVIPYDPSYAKSIEQAIYSSNQNLTPKLQSDGSFLISIPRLTAEGRQMLAKESGQLCEQARAALRNIRQSAQKSSKLDLDSNVITKDDFKLNQKKLDDISKNYNKIIDGIELKAKNIILDK